MCRTAPWPFRFIPRRSERSPKAMWRTRHDYGQTQGSTDPGSTRAPAGSHGRQGIATGRAWAYTADLAIDGAGDPPGTDAADGRGVDCLGSRSGWPCHAAPHDADHE